MAGQVTGHMNGGRRRALRGPPTDICTCRSHAGVEVGSPDGGLTGMCVPKRPDDIVQDLRHTVCLRWPAPVQGELTVDLHGRLRATLSRMGQRVPTTCR